MAETVQKKERISNSTLTIMVIVALLFDLLEIGLLLLWGIGLILNSLVVFVKWWIFWFWFGYHNVPFAKFESKKAVQRFLVIPLTLLIGVIPLIGALPEFTVGVLVMGLLVKAEDKLGVTIPLTRPTSDKTRTIRRSAYQNRASGLAEV